MAAAAPLVTLIEARQRKAVACHQFQAAGQHLRRLIRSPPRARVEVRLTQYETVGMAGIQRHDFLLVRVPINNVPRPAIAKVGFGHRVRGVRHAGRAAQAGQKRQRAANPVLRVAAAELQRRG
jgi:hypothetical protein